MMRAFRASLIAICCMLFVAAAGCASDTAVSSSKPEVVLRVSGSGVTLKLLKLLGAEYGRPEIGFEYTSGLHSSGGVRGVESGDLEIGCVSRELTPAELELGLEYVKLSDDGLVIAVHPAAGIDALTSEEVRRVYAGEFENWSELGGADIDIVILDRNEDESAKIILRQFILGPGQPVTDSAVSLFTESDMATAVSETPGAIGYFSLGHALSAEVDVTLVALDGVTPSVGTIISGEYAMVRPLGIVVPPTADDATSDFVEWAAGEDAQRAMAEHGFAPSGQD